jgi:hypothetical protein
LNDVVANYARAQPAEAEAVIAAAKASRLEKHAKWFLNLIAARPDFTLDEVLTTLLVAVWETVLGAERIIGL